MAKTPKKTFLTKQNFLNSLYLSVLLIFIAPFIEVLYVWLFVDQYAGLWGMSQMLDSMYPRSTNSAPLPIVSSIESEGWSKWTEKHQDDPIIAPMDIDVLDFTLPTIRKTTFGIDLSKPILIKGFLNQSGSTKPSWDLDWLKMSPQGEVEVEYADDTRVAFIDGGAVFDAKGLIKDVVKRIENGDPVKTGTQLIFEKYPDLLYELPLKGLHALFGAYFFPSRMGKMLTVPTFLSKGPKVKQTNKEGEEGETIKTLTKETTRTDFHCEPIANVALQFVGSKKWTLLSPLESKGLRPSLSPDGRAFVYANLDPDDISILKLKRYELYLEKGDLLYVPTWWWHRVDYIPDITSLTVSLFHVRIEQLIKNNPLYAAAVFPNLLKELIGWKTK